jgi:CheY-like chemotaxis protein
MTNPLNFAEKRTVLVVDDEPDNLTLLSAVLKDEYKVKVANSGARALQAMQSGPLPDLVLLDVMMPEMDGTRCCRRMRDDPRHARSAGDSSSPRCRRPRTSSAASRSAQWTTSPSRSALRRRLRACAPTSR